MIEAVLLVVVGLGFAFALTFALTRVLSDRERQLKAKNAAADRKGRFAPFSPLLMSNVRRR